MMAESEQNRLWGEALAKIPSGVSILTAAHESQSTGMLASWVQQASFTPPLVSVCVKQTRPILSLIAGSAAFCLNIVGENTGPLFKHFGPGFSLDQDAFAGLEAQSSPQGIILKDAIAVLACKVVGGMDAGDHRLLLGEVVGAQVFQAAGPYVHLRKTGFSY